MPFFLRWPAKVTPNTYIDRIAAHIDVLPTLLEACAIRPATPPKFDGRSLVPLLSNDAPAWPDRVLHTQWHRGDVPQLFRAHAARSQRWKLVNGAELYDMEQDPAESTDVASAHPDEVRKLRQATEAWFRDVSATRHGYAPPRSIWARLTKTPCCSPGRIAATSPRLGRQCRRPRPLPDHGALQARSGGGHPPVLDSVASPARPRSPRVPNAL